MFTTPIYGGNSGGPLVDISGYAIGIIIRKSFIKNLYIATPINLVRQNLGIKVSFPRLVMKEDTGEVTTHSYFTLYRGPRALKSIWKRISMDRTKAYLQLRNKHRKNYGLNSFSYKRKVASSTIVNNVPDLAGFIVANKRQAYQFTDFDFNYIKRKNNTMLLLGSKPFKKLIPFFSPYTKHHNIMKDFLANASLNIHYWGEAYQVKGMKSRKNKLDNFKDSLGRKWSIASWDIKVLESVYLQVCSPTKGGMFCLANILPDSISKLENQLLLRDALAKVIFNRTSKQKQFGTFKGSRS